MLLEQGPYVSLQSTLLLDLTVFVGCHFDEGLRIAVSVLHFVLKSTFRLVVNLERIKPCLQDGHSEVATFSLRVFSRLVDVGRVIVDLCDCDGSILCQEIFISHKEDAVVNVKVTDSLLFLSTYIVPVGIFITPTSSVLPTLTPGVSQLNQSLLVALEWQYDRRKQSVGMSLHDAFGAFVGV